MALYSRYNREESHPSRGGATNTIKWEDTPHTVVTFPEVTRQPSRAIPTRATYSLGPPTYRPRPPHPCQDMQPADETLRALYRINKEAKQQASLAQTASSQNRQRAAQEHSRKKQALYDLKELVLADIHPHADRIEHHRIDNRGYLCFYFDNWSFHLPGEAVSIEDDRISESKTLHDFDPGTQPEGQYPPLREALQHFNDEWGINANSLLDPLPARSEGYSHTQSWAGWPCLSARSAPQPGD